MTSRRIAQRVLIGVALAVMAGCAGALEDTMNLFGKQRKLYDAAKEAAAAGRNYEAAINAMDALDVKSDYADARILLRQVGPNAYQERFGAIQQLERTNGTEAIIQYKELRAFTERLRRLGVAIATVDYDAKLRELENTTTQLRTGETEKAYAEADAFFRAGDCGQAVAAYRRVLELSPRHQEASEGIAECRYRSAVADLGARRYRQAAEGFKQATAERSGFRDSQPRAARIYSALGVYFLKAGYPRSALPDLEAANQLAPDLPGLKSDLEVARRAAVRRLAIVGIENKSGHRIEGLAIEEYISDECHAEIQKRKSQFIDLYDRSQLDKLMKELKLGLSDLVDKTSVPQLGRLKGVEYLVIGKLTQVTEKKLDPQKNRRSFTYRFQQPRQEERVDSRGKRQVVIVPGPPQTEQVYWDEVSWTVEVAFAGSFSVLDVQTGRVAAASNFTKREAAGGRWAQDLSNQQAMSSLPADTRKLFTAPRNAESVEVVRKRVLANVVAEAVGTMLGELDQTPKIADPPQLTGRF